MSTTSKKVLIYNFPVIEPDKKNKEPQSEFTAVAMAERVCELLGDCKIDALWVSRKDADKEFSLDNGLLVRPKNGVPRGSVYAFVEPIAISNPEPS